jgi:hypothetical protein
VNQVGEINLTKGKRRVKFFIFDKDVKNHNAFNSIYENYGADSSCRGGYFSFYLGDFIFIPELCPNCDIENDRTCEKLNNSIHSWWFNHTKLKFPTTSTIE